MSPVQKSDLLINSLGSATPPTPTDCLARLLLAWRNEVEREPMPKWVA